MPVMLLYAIASGIRADISAIKRVGAVLLALVIGNSVAAVYVFPLVAYQRLFDWNQMVTNLPYFLEFGRSFLFVSARRHEAHAIEVPDIAAPPVRPSL
jgi:hypothetical protein